MASRSQSLECVVHPKHLLDHKTDHNGVNLKIRWTIGGMPNDVKPPWKFRNHLLELPAFCKEMKSGIMETLIKKVLETHYDQIPLVKKDFLDTSKHKCWNLHSLKPVAECKVTKKLIR